MELDILPYDVWLRLGSIFSVVLKCKNRTGRSVHPCTLWYLLTEGFVYNPEDGDHLK